jgi:hypothetical protein
LKGGIGPKARPIGIVSETPEQGEKNAYMDSSPGEGAPTQIPKVKRKLSAAGRAAIIAATKKMWAAKRAAAKAATKKTAPARKKAAVKKAAAKAIVPAAQ